MPDDGLTAAEEVAEDYRRELEELSGINRAEISTLTMIARESTEHAMAISDVLVQHIIKVRERVREGPMQITASSSSNHAA